MLLLHQLPEALVRMLVSEWIDPEYDLARVVIVFGVQPFTQLAALPGMEIRTTKWLPKSCHAWMGVFGLRVIPQPTCVYSRRAKRYEWRVNGSCLHRDGDLPALVFDDGGKEWFQHGERHRDGDLPAIIRPFGSQSWYRNGELHRDGDLPAVIHQFGSQFWYRNGKLHRDGGRPACIYADGSEKFYRNGIQQE